MDRDKIFGKKSKSVYLYCIHCERTYLNGKFRKTKDEHSGEILQMCPYEDCDGDTVLDAWDWTQILESHPKYPKVPEEGKVYPMY